jgi:hypothetical protein
MTEMEQLIESWHLADEYERIDEERWESDVRYSVLDKLNELSRNDRKLFWKEVDSAKQNGN